jgi:hypothetical protein
MSSGLQNGFKKAAAFQALGACYALRLKSTAIAEFQ